MSPKEWDWIFAELEARRVKEGFPIYTGFPVLPISVSLSSDRGSQS